MFNITSDSIHKHSITVMQQSSILRVRSNLNRPNVKLNSMEILRELSKLWLKYELGN